MLDESKSFGFPEMGYANCWEDSRVLCQALRPAPGKRILSIASGGDNSFSLAAEGATVIAVDRNPSQIACVELKRVALAKLTYAEVLEFFGLRPFENRGEVYQALASGLSEKSRSYWNLHLSDIEHGFVHSGKFERYFHYFRKFVLPLVHRRGDVQGLLQKRSKEERARYYEEVWNTFRWQALMRIFCSRPVMSRLGRDASCFSHVEGSVVDHAIARARHALVDLPTHDNPFLEYIVTGTFSNNLPHYLEPDNFDAVRDGLGRVNLFEGSIEEAAGSYGQDGFDGYNLSDLFEYMSETDGLQLHAELLQYARPAARIAYWNMMVPRRFAQGTQSGIMELRELADSLHAGDQGFFYQDFVLEETAS